MVAEWPAIGLASLLQRASMAAVYHALRIFAWKALLPADALASALPDGLKVANAVLPTSAAREDALGVASHGDAPSGTQPLLTCQNDSAWLIAVQRAQEAHLAAGPVTVADGEPCICWSNVQVGAAHLPAIRTADAMAVAGGHHLLSLHREASAQQYCTVALE